MPLLSGSVVVKFTGQPLAGVPIYINKNYIETDDNGNFSIELPEGYQSILIYVAGFETYKEIIYLDKDKNIIIELTPKVRIL